MGICKNVSTGALAIAKIGDFLEWLKVHIELYWKPILILILVIVALIVLR